MEHGVYGFYACRAAAFARCFRPSLTITIPTNDPMAASPAHNKNAGSRTAHSRAGNKLCSGWSAGKKG